MLKQRPFWCFSTLASKLVLAFDSVGEWGGVRVSECQRNSRLLWHDYLYITIFLDQPPVMKLFLQQRMSVTS